MIIQWVVMFMRPAEIQEWFKRKDIMKTHVFLSIVTILIFAGCQASTEPSPQDHVHEGADSADKPVFDPSKIITGNGENNYIKLENASRKGSVFTFSEVMIAQKGFLVMHPFRNGQPVQTEYVGAVPVPMGLSLNVEIPVTVDVESGDKFIVMLHKDMNQDGEFDFGDGITVPDAPVFEGYRLVALRYEIP